MDGSGEAVRVVVAGGGIGGLSAAIALRRAGVDATVYERAPELREVGAGISLWPNATRILREWGVLDPLLRRGVQVEAGEMLRADGRVLHRFSVGALDAPLLLVHRADLHAALADALPPWAVQTGYELDGFDDDGPSVVARFRGGPTAEGDALVGADGLRSATRAALLGDGPPVYRGYPVWRGVARMDLPAGRERVLTETLGRGMRAGVVPVGEGRVAWWVTANEPAATPDGADAEAARARLLSLVRGWHFPVPALVEATPADQILKSDTFDRPPVRRWGRGRVTLLGDAAHPTTPNLGQGGCMAIEDAAVLARCFANTDGVVAALRAFERARSGRTALVTRQSLWYGAMAQAQAAPAVAVRDLVFRLTPGWVSTMTLRKMAAWRV